MIEFCSQISPILAVNFVCLENTNDKSNGMKRNYLKILIFILKLNYPHHLF